MRKRTEKAQTTHGEYIVPAPSPDREIFWLRRVAIWQSEEFWKYCSDPDIKKMEKDTLRAWRDLSGWLSKGPTPLEICLLIYGNVYKHTVDTSWIRYQNSFKHYMDALQASLFQELPPGTLAPEGMLSIAMDPHIRRDELVRIFERFLTSRRKAITETAVVDPLRGYFHVTEKRFNPELVHRYLDVYSIWLNCNARYMYDYCELYGTTWPSKQWRREVFYSYPEIYTGSESKKRGKAYKELERAKNISSWAVRGRFPCTKPLK